MLLFPLAVNAAYAVFYAYVVWFDYVVITPELAVMPVKGVYASKLIWLTMVNLFIQLAYHSIGALLAKGARSYGEKKISIRLFHFIASAIVFPIAWTVVLLFWGLYFFDPNTLLTEDAKRVMSISWFNHALHTVPGIAATVDFVAWRHPRPNKLAAVVIICAFIAAYLSGVNYVHDLNGFWAYPILGDLDSFGRACFYAFSAAITFALFLVGDRLSAIVNRLFGIAANKSKKRR